MFHYTRPYHSVYFTATSNAHAIDSLECCLITVNTVRHCEENAHDYIEGIRYI